MLTPERREELAELNPDALCADGFEAAFVGVARQFNRALACYDRSRCIGILVSRDGMTHEEAEEYFEFNVAGAYMGENTPIFLETIEADAEVSDGRTKEGEYA